MIFIWSVFNVNSNGSSSNLGLSGQIDGFNSESVVGLGLTGTILGYNVKNYNINRDNLSINTKNLSINEQNLEINKRTLAINQHIRDIADAHLDIDILENISKSLIVLNDKMERNNYLLGKLLENNKKL